jgi:hypothetical protein
MKNTNSNYKFSLFKDLFAKTPEQTIDVNQLIEFVKYPYLKSEIDRLRSLDKEEYKKQKVKLPSVTLSGIFSERKDIHVLKHSGLIQIDFDDVSEYNKTRTALIDDPYTYVLFRSPSANGIKMLVKVNPSEETHTAQFLALEEYYLEEFHLQMDKNTKNVSRAMLLSYDPHLFCNPFSETFAEVIDEKKYKQKNTAVNTLKEPRAIYYTQNISEGKEEFITNKLCDAVRERNVDLTDSYHNWRNIGFILSSTFAECGRNYFHQLSAQHPEYNFDKCDAKYTQLHKDNNGGLSFGTLVYMARDRGIELFEEEPKSEQTPTPKTGLREALKKKRLEIANENGKPAFTIFSNKTLESLLIELPKSDADLELVYGFGKKKVQQFGTQILKVINSYIA